MESVEKNWGLENHEFDYPDILAGLEGKNMIPLLEACFLSSGMGKLGCQRGQAATCD
jgi:hypothetical protein